MKRFPAQNQHTYRDKESNTTKSSKNNISYKKEHVSYLPPWLKIKLPTDFSCVDRLKVVMKERKLHSVCQEASCPNIFECFSRKSAAFMLMGAICTRRCPFCDVSHGKPQPVDKREAEHLAITIQQLKLKYVVLTSVNRDDLLDGGAQHFVNCMRAIRSLNPKITIEILVPDFHRCTDTALKILASCPPDVFNHNMETVPRLYRSVRPGARYQRSLELLSKFKQDNPTVPTKSGLMVGLGETLYELYQVMDDLRAHQVSMLTIGQYLQPDPKHLAVTSYLTPAEFKHIQQQAKKRNFTHVACGPLVRSSYYAEQQAQKVLVPKKHN